MKIYLKKLNFRLTKQIFWFLIFKENVSINRKQSKRKYKLFEKFLVTIFLKYILKKGFTDFWEKIKVLISGGAALTQMSVFF